MRGPEGPLFFCVSVSPCWLRCLSVAYGCLRGVRLCSRAFPLVDVSVVLEVVRGLLGRILLS